MQFWQATEPRATKSLGGRSVMPMYGLPINLFDEHSQGRWRD